MINTRRRFYLLKSVQGHANTHVEVNDKLRAVRNEKKRLYEKIYESNKLKKSKCDFLCDKIFFPPCYHFAIINATFQNRVVNLFSSPNLSFDRYVCNSNISDRVIVTMKYMNEITICTETNHRPMITR